MEYKTIDNRWDILYRDYPEIYDEFAAVPKTPGLFPKYAKLFNFKDKMILDIASGSGLSSFEMRPYCKSIIGIEPEDAMRDLAEKNAKEKNFTDIAFKKGKADNVPLPDNSVDISVAITLSIFDPKEIRSYVKEQMRVVKKRGAGR